MKLTEDKISEIFITENSGIPSPLTALPISEDGDGGDEDDHEELLFSA